MEIFRQMPSEAPSVSLAAMIGNLSPPLDLWRRFIYCHSMCGHKYGEVDHFQVMLISWLRLSLIAYKYLVACSDMACSLSGHHLTLSEIHDYFKA